MITPQRDEVRDCPESIRMGIKDVSARWLKATKAIEKEDQIYGQKLAVTAKIRPSEAFYDLDDLLVAAFYCL